MGLRFLADHCVSNFIIQALQGESHVVVRLKDVLPVESTDTTVIAKAQELGAILVSLNGDFADIVTYPPKAYKGIIAIQVRNRPEALPHLVMRLLAYLGRQPEMEHFAGRLVVVEPGRIRVRE